MFQGVPDVKSTISLLFLGFGPEYIFHFYRIIVVISELKRFTMFLKDFVY